jgi:hypothetical protein
MCKIYGLTNTSKLSAQGLAQMITRAHAQLTSTQKDGWGYALGSFSEKWDSPPQWPGPNEWQAIRDSLGGIAVSADCEITGAYPGPGPSLVAHARTATCARGAVNAHPHFSGGWTVVHNGVVESTHKRQRSCDSMHIADSLAASGGASGLHDDVTGYLAILGTDPEGRFFALRDSRAPLYVARVPSLDAWAFASTPELLRSIAGEPTPRPYELDPYAYHLLTPAGWTIERVTPWSAYAALSSKASKAFGDDEYANTGGLTPGRWGRWRKDARGNWTDEPPAPEELKAPKAPKAPKAKKGPQSKFPDWPDK